jgi:hypothetical protein
MIILVMCEIRPESQTIQNSIITGGTFQGRHINIVLNGSDYGYFKEFDL